MMKPRLKREALILKGVICLKKYTQEHCMYTYWDDGVFMKSDVIINSVQQQLLFCKKAEDKR